MILIRCNVVVNNPPSKRALSRAGKKAHQAMGELWLKEMFPKHFKPGAAKAYGHKERSAKYLEWKRKAYNRRWRLRPHGQTVKQGGRVDNVLTGQMKRELQATANARGFPSRTTVKMQGPAYAQMRPFQGSRSEAISKGWKYGKRKKFSTRAGTQPAKGVEITTTTPAERDTLAKIAESVFVHELNK